MNPPVKPNSLQSYQVILYGRALHPELFPLKRRKVVKHNGYEFEVWGMEGAHLLRFEMGSLCASELCTGHDGKLPDTGIVSAFLCAGERDFEHRFPKEKVLYMTTVQTETLSENLYLATFAELTDYARSTDAMALKWSDETGDCLSVIDLQRFNKEIHAQCYHMIASGGLVVRTQTIFEHQ
jgi:hypothetical protein